MDITLQGRGSELPLLVINQGMESKLPGEDPQDPPPSVNKYGGVIR